MVIPTAFGADSYLANGESMIEGTFGTLIMAIAGSELLGPLGRLTPPSGTSPVKLIIDGNIASIIKRVISGVKVDDDSLAWEEILDTSPGGNYLQRAHTLRHCRDAIRNRLFVKQPIDTWMAEGSKNLYTRAVEEYRELKKKLQPQQLPKDIQKELNRIVKHADEHLVK